jgi:hypothetical protein
MRVAVTALPCTEFGWLRVTYASWFEGWIVIVVARATPPKVISRLPATTAPKEVRLRIAGPPVSVDSVPHEGDPR